MRSTSATEGQRTNVNDDCNYDSKSFFSTLEFELLRKHDWHTRDEARRAIFEYIEVWYNRKRMHSTLGYLSPSAYEAQLQLMCYPSFRLFTRSHGRCFQRVDTRVPMCMRS